MSGWASLRIGRLGTNPPPAHGEQFLELARVGGAMIEEIVSSDSPYTGLQLQDHDEWFVVLSGTAELEVEGESLSLTAGDWVVVPARTPHRVLRTDACTRWLAVRGAATHERPFGGQSAR